MTISILIVAAGTGQRAGGGLVPKQYQPLGGKAVLVRTVEAFTGSGLADRVQVVIHPDHEDLYKAAFPAPLPGLLPPVHGGTSRQDSVLRGLRQLAPHKPDHVLIHYAARPFVSRKIIQNTIETLRTSPAVLAAIPVTDTIKKVENGQVAHTLDRSSLMAAQTPQGFAFSQILDLHEQAAKEQPDTFTDDIALAEWQNIPVTIVDGSPENFKLTTPNDLLLANLIWQQKHPDV